MLSNLLIIFIAGLFFAVVFTIFYFLMFCIITKDLSDEELQDYFKKLYENQKTDFTNVN